MIATAYKRRSKRWKYFVELGFVPVGSPRDGYDEMIITPEVFIKIDQRLEKLERLGFQLRGGK